MDLQHVVSGRFAETRVIAKLRSCPYSSDRDFEGTEVSSETSEIPHKLDIEFLKILAPRTEAFY